MPTQKIVSDILSYFEENPISFSYSADKLNIDEDRGPYLESAITEYLRKLYGDPEFDLNDDDPYKLAKDPEPYLLIPNVIDTIFHTIESSGCYVSGPFICHNFTGRGGYNGGDTVWSEESFCCMDCLSSKEEIHYQIKIPKKYKRYDFWLVFKIDAMYGGRIEKNDLFVDFSCSEDESPKVRKFFHDLWWELYRYFENICSEIAIENNGDRYDAACKIYFELEVHRDKFTLDGEFLKYDLIIPYRLAKEEFSQMKQELEAWPFPITDDPVD